MSSEKLVVNANGRVTGEDVFPAKPLTSVLDVLYAAALHHSWAAFAVAPSMRTGTRTDCHVIVAISGFRTDRKQRWMITVRNRRNKVSEGRSENSATNNVSTYLI